MNIRPTLCPSAAMLDGRRVRYVKGAPEIVRSLCVKAVGDESVETLNERLLGYQRQAPRSQCLHHRWCMKRMILVTGGIFFLLLLGFVYVCEHTDVTSLTDLCNLQFGTGMGLSALEKSYIFTFFVMLQFWNMFNARAYLTGQSAFHFNQNSPSFDGKRGSFSLGPPCFVQKVARD